VEEEENISDKLLAKYCSTGMENRKEGEEIEGEKKTVDYL